MPPKLNGYLKEFTIALRTDVATGFTGPFGPGWSWKINWLDLVPPDIPPASNFHVEHFFQGAVPILEPIKAADFVTDVSGVTPIPFATVTSLESGCFLCNLCQRSIFSLDATMPPTHTNQVNTQFYPGFLNIVERKVESYVPLNSQMIAASSNFNVTEQYGAFLFRYTSPKLSFVCNSPEKFANIEVCASPFGTADPDAVRNYAGEPTSISGIHVFKFKLID